MGHWAQNQGSAMSIPVLWPEPCRKWERWTEEKKHRHGAGNLKGLEWFWMKKRSLISCQVCSNLIRHYRIQFRAAKLANGGIKKYWIKACRLLWPMCSREKHLFHNDITPLEWNPPPPFIILIIQWKVRFFLNKISKGLIMQIHFYSLLW